MKDLEAGPELDALIAEKVMGCKPVGRGVYARCHCPGNPHAFCKLHETEDSGQAELLMSYSTDIAAAWEVVERIKGLSAFGGIPFVLRFTVAGNWEVTLSQSDEPGMHFCSGPPCCLTGVASTAPLAICRAALKAVAS